jgi:hypothetical protein
MMTRYRLSGFSFLTLALTLVPGLSSCGNSSPATDVPGLSAQTPVSARWQSDRLMIDVPVPVIAIGFPVADVAGLSAKLRTHRVDHTAGDLNQPIPPDPDEIEERGPTALLPLFGESYPHPVLPNARFQVSAASAAMENEFRTMLSAARLDGNRFDAIAIEDWLANALPRYGFPLNKNAPSIVVLHLDAFGVSNHGWKHQGRTGWLEPVRVFGERYPLLVLDPSAVPDPYAGTGNFRDTLPASATELIADFVIEAVEYRVLQASIYPVAQAPCHAVTGIMGIRPGSIAEATPLLRSVEEALHPEWIKGAFDHLTGTNVFFDLKILHLPVDDPVLDAIARGEFPAFEVMRGYLTLMWDQYHVDRPGCEGYLSVVFAGDVATVPGGGIIGIGTYDDRPTGRRISMSWVAEIFRLTFDPESPVCTLACEQKEYLNWWDYLFIHETGHILGQRHTHDKSSNTGYGTSNNAFSSVWSTMSYQQDGRVADFGAIDHANWLRNRAGFALLHAARGGREGSPAWNQAMDAARLLNWQGVWAALQE